jgi:hypothetical protein
VNNELETISKEAKEPNLWCHSRICLEKLRKLKETSTRRVGLLPRSEATTFAFISVIDENTHFFIYLYNIYFILITEVLIKIINLM